ncbi:hypothetical protein ACO1GV_05735 [Fusobacterium watanabei]|uniref:hypothetical protein n=1 Tax=Fusobacterium watanabei TaxID=2686067 RepID=UPI003B58A930
MKKKLLILLGVFFIIVISTFIIYNKIQKEKELEALKRRYLIETQRIVPNTEYDVITIH